MNVSIPNIGSRFGTCGWLSKGLADGSIVIRLGRCKAPHSNHGLWLHFGDRQQVLALFNPYDLSDYECSGSEKFVTTDDAPGILERNHSFTEACWSFLMEIAQKWCDAQNNLRVGDDASPLASVRVSFN